MFKTFLSFRIDMIDDYDVYTLLFLDFFYLFQCEQFIVAFEDRTKSGLPTKPHFHGMAHFPHTIKPDSMRDKVKKWFNNTGHTGTHSYVKTVEDHDFYTAFYYTTKQGEILITDYSDEELDDLLTQSKEYQNKLSLKLNSWPEHSEYILTTFLKPYHEQNKYISRAVILRYIHQHIMKWNLEHERKHHIFLPCRNSIISYFYYVEMLLLTPEESFQNIYTDFESVMWSSGNHEITSSIYKNIDFIDEDDSSAANSKNSL